MAKKKIIIPTFTHAELLRVVSYDESTGVFRYLISTAQRVKPGDVAGGRMKGGYWVVKVLGYALLAHRLAWFYVHKRWPAAVLDHINGDGCNNAIVNLRECTHRQNTQNAKRAGFSFNPSRPYAKKYQALITVAGKLKHLGFFMTADEAKAAYLAATVEHFDDFSVVNRAQEVAKRQVLADSLTAISAGACRCPEHL